MDTTPRRCLILAGAVLAALLIGSAQAETTAIAVTWATAPSGTVSVDRGRLVGLQAEAGGWVDGASFHFPAGRAGRLVLQVEGTTADDETGTLVSINSPAATFTFRLADPEPPLRPPAITGPTPPLPPTSRDAISGPSCRKSPPRRRNPLRRPRLQPDR